MPRRTSLGAYEPVTRCACSVRVTSSCSAPKWAEVCTSYPPRACGIATFTRDLSEAVATSGYTIGARIAAINGEGAVYGFKLILMVTK